MIQLLIFNFLHDYINLRDMKYVKSSKISFLLFSSFHIDALVTLRGPKMKLKYFALEN